MKAFVEEMKRRKVFRVAAIYLFISWLLMQVGDVMFPALRFPQWAITLLVAFLILGLPIVLVLSWAFDITPEGIKRTNDTDAGGSVAGVSARNIFLVFVVVLTTGALLFMGRSWIFDSGGLSDKASSAAQGQPLMPLVIMMDSHHPSRVYDEDVLASGGTNADVVSDILLDLPIRRQKEAVSPDWHRDEDILGFRPDLVIIHFSSFLHGRVDGPRLRFGLFIEFLADSDTQFLVYSRATDVELQQYMNGLLADVDQQHPGLLDRVHVFGMLSHGKPKWRDPAIATSLKLRVKKILAIE